LIFTYTSVEFLYNELIISFLKKKYLKVLVILNVKEEKPTLQIRCTYGANVIDFMTWKRYLHNNFINFIHPKKS